MVLDSSVVQLLGPLALNSSSRCFNMRTQGVRIIRAHADAVLAASTWKAEINLRNPRRYTTTVSNRPRGEKGSWSGGIHLKVGASRSVQPQHPKQRLES